MTSTIAAPASRGPARGRPALGWVALILVCLARGYRALLLTLVVAALLPVAWNWDGYVVRSGSMEPRISTGDVVIAAPFGPADEVPVGRVMILTDPARPQGRDPLVHRVVAAADDGTFTTKGDANSGDDTTPVPRENIHARAVLLVPYVGAPLIWASTGSVGLLAAWSLLTAAAFYGAGAPGRSRRRRNRPSVPLAGAGGTIPRPRSGFRPRTPHLPTALGSATIVAIVAVAVGGTGPALAAFSERTKTAGNVWAVAFATSTYHAQVLADDPRAYYRVDEASGTSMGDSSGAGRNGTYAAVGTYRQAGALSGGTGYAVGLAGANGRLVSGGAALSNPTTFTLEMWVKTSTRTGGKLIGFENTQGATSPTFDRHLFMRPDGRIVYGGWGSENKLLTTPAAYNDGAWHHLVLTASPQGALQNSNLYIDGLRVAADTTTKTGFYAGWWRVGYGSLPAGTGFPVSANFTGLIDEVAIYPGELSAGRVAVHYAAR